MIMLQIESPKQYVDNDFCCICTAESSRIIIESLVLAGYCERSSVVKWERKALALLQKHLSYWKIINITS